MLGWSILVQFIGVKNTMDFGPRNRSFVPFGNGEDQGF